jgi:CDP-glucose 4,6-dehydratase
MESLELNMDLFNNIYKNKKILVTGHTGFKGSWLCAWLEKLGATVYGISLPANTEPNHFSLLNLKMKSLIADIRDREKIEALLSEIKPDFVFHLAAQPIVIDSYSDPVGTYSTNVMGLMHVLEACRKVSTVKGIINVTSDKCYENKEWVYPYRENDPMGGHDPYSSSKGCSEILTASYRKSFFHDGKVLLASARAGNVIGGGDWASYRIIPDLMRSYVNKETLAIRFPQSTRPWQHVLTPLYGYLLLGAKLLEDKTSFSYDSAWNFGPALESNVSVEILAKKVQEIFPSIQIEWGKPSNLHEAKLLNLDSSMASVHLGFKPVWDFEQTVKFTCDWYKSFYSAKKILTNEQIDAFSERAKNVIS